ncbi:MAG: LamG domain-containing protein, partial [Planctomycetes bacterium]|nr:LamG domain-containing protein [Planctomycetota bacterium]
MDKLLIVFTIVAGLVALAQAEPVELLRFDFSKDVKDTPGLEVVGDAAVEGGTLRSASQAKWQRSGLSVGPVPVSGGALIVEYDVYPVRRGAQCQEFTSQTPSTHWYMIFVGPDGRLRFHTRSKGEWKHRASSEAKCEAGKWYHVTVSLARQSISYRIAERDTGTLVWQAGPIEMDDLGEETVFILTDEAPT